MSEELTATGLRFRLDGQGWIIAAVWLLFLLFPLMSIWTDDLGLTRRVVGTGLLAAFGAAYLVGFRHTQRWYYLNQCLPFDSASAAPHRHLYLGAMGLFLALGYLVAGVGVLGAASYIVAFAAFNLTWRGAVVVGLSTIATVVAEPMLTGDPFLGLLFGGICLVVGTATLLTRSFEEREHQQTKLETKLAVSDERSRLARDVHDVIGHNLTATILKVELTQKLLDGVEAASPSQQARLDRGRRELEELEAVNRRSLAEIRATISGIRTADLADELDAARGVLADAGVAITVTNSGGDRLAAADRVTLAWVVREAVTNVVRHAHASTCHIHVGPTTVDGQAVMLRIVDDGVGFAGHEGNGLTGLRERLEAVGLQLSLQPPRSRSSGSWSLRSSSSGSVSSVGRVGTDLRVVAAAGGHRRLTAAGVKPSGIGSRPPTSGRRSADGSPRFLEANP